MASKISREEYLREDFDYTRLTKQELRAIMSENNVMDIPPITALKSTITEAYKAHIHDRIDILRKEYETNFSNENIFQSQSSNDSHLEEPECTTDRVEITLPQNKSMSFIANNTPNPTSTSFASNQNTTFAEQSSGATYNKDTLTTAEDTLSKIIALPLNSPFLQRFCTPLRILLLILVVLTVYLKFYCPYCQNDESFCIPVPPHSRIVEGKLRCDPGYRPVFSLVDHCIRDYTEEEKRKRKAKKIIQLLESIKGNAKYGFGERGVVRLADLSDDPSVIHIVCNSSRVICRDGAIEAVEGRISPRLFLRYYLVRLSRIMALVALSVLTIKVFLWRRRRRLARDAKIREDAKQAAVMLSKQLACAARSNLFLPHIREDKLRDALELNSKAWKAVRAQLLKNANVSVVEGEGGHNLWQWTGPILNENY